MSIEELMNESVTSVSKRAQKLSDAPAAIYVIDNEDLHRSGATTLADALRMAPGLSVAQYRSHEWIVTSRGFSEEFSGKLLALVDGRSVYNAGHSAVAWGVQSVMLEDVERIEVIRGPAGTLWGANAVNGVINIIMKTARDTQGGLLVGTVGTEEEGGGVRYGGQIADRVFYRVYAHYSGFGESATFHGDDSSQLLKSGVRVDWEPDDRNLLTVQGELYAGEMDNEFHLRSLTPPLRSVVQDDAEVSGGHVLGRWDHVFSDRSQASLQVFYDRFERNSPRLIEAWDTFDLELQHNLGLTDWNHLIWGVGYRYTQARIDDNFRLQWSDENPGADLFNLFFQDEIHLFADRLTLTVGSKFERHYFDHWEIQPSGRFLWKPRENHSVWGAVSRAVRTPNFTQNYQRVNLSVSDADGPGPAAPRVMAIFPNPDVDSESVIAWELGYRAQLHERFYVDLASFYNEYDNLEEETELPFFFESTPSPRHAVIGSLTANAMHGETYGVELSPAWQVTENWRLSASYSLLKMALHSETPEREEEELEGDSPQNQFQLRSYLDLPGNVSFDAMGYYVDSLGNQDLPSYVRVDVRLGWQPTERLELSAGVRNLLDDQHPEFRARDATPAEFERTFYARLIWRF